MSDAVSEVSGVESSIDNSVSDVVNTSATSDWRSQLSDEFKESASLKDFKDINSLAKSYISAQELLGRSVRIPTEDASTEVKEEFYKKLENIPGVLRYDPEKPDAVMERLGKPRDPNEYKFELPEDLEVIPDKVSEFKQFAHQLGLTQKQASELANFEATRQKGYMDSLIERRNSHEQMLKKEWGEDYTNRLTGVRALIDKFGEKYPDAAQDLLTNVSAGNPITFMALAELSKIYQESGQVIGSSKISFGMSATEARDRIRDIQNNKDHPYFNYAHPQHDQAVEEMRNYYRIATSGE